MPDWKRLVRERLAGAGIPPDREESIIEELSQDLEQRYVDALDSGLSPEHAERGVAQQLDAAALCAEVKRSRTVAARPLESPEPSAPWWTNVAYDLRYAWRALRLSPAFTVAALLSLALGIGANTSIFELLNALRLKTVPIPDPGQLVEVRPVDMRAARGAFYTRRPVVTHPQWEEIRDHQKVLDGLFAWYRDSFNLAPSGEARLVEGLEVSGSFFSTLDLRPAVGRLIDTKDDVPGCGTPVAVISNSYWRQQYGGASDVVGRSITLERHPFEIIGVAPDGFFGLEVGRTFDVAVPLCTEPLLMGELNRLHSSRDWWLTVMGRLKPGITASQASAYFDALSPGIFRATLSPQYPADVVPQYLAAKLSVYPAATGVSELRGAYTTPLWLLLAIATLVMLIACANLANLLLARASTREREIGIRLTVGASRQRLVRQLMLESALLAGVGAVLGLALSSLLTRLFISFLQTRGNPVFLDIRPDDRVLAFTVGIAALTCLLFGLAPAISASAADPGTALKVGARGLIGGRRRFLVRRGLVVVQVALSAVLVIAALLFTQSLRNLLQVDAGFDQHGLIIASIDMTAMKLPPDRRLSVKQQIVDEIRRQPGVENAAQVLVRPLSGRGWDDTAWIEGNEANAADCWFNQVSPEFFQTVRIPVRAGRSFTHADTRNSPAVAIVNETFSKTLIRGQPQSAVGKYLIVGTGGSESHRRYEIVGVVRNVKYASLREGDLPQVYLAAAQDAEPNEFARALIRTSLGSATAIRQANAALAIAAPKATVNYRVLREEVEDGLLRERLMATLSLFFGILAAALATVGLYGVLSYTLAVRTNEIGVRMALGASRTRIVRMVVSDALRLIAFGLAGGTAAALAFGRVAESLLFDLRPNDPAALLTACLVLGATGIAAALIPAARAARLEPVIALRSE